MSNNLKQETRRGLLEFMKETNELKEQKQQAMAEILIGGTLLVAATAVTAVTTAIALNKIGEDLGLDNEEDVELEVEIECVNEEGVM